MIAKNIAILATLLGVCSALGAQDQSMVVVGAYDALAYPDLDYTTHPTLLLRFTSPIDSYDGRVAMDFVDVVKKRMDDSVGAFDGTSRERVTDLSGRLALDTIRPTKGSTRLLGGFISGGLKTFDLAMNRYDNPTQNLLTQTLDWPLGLGLGGTMAFRSGAIEQAYGLRYELDFQPHYFTTTTDVTQQPPRVKIEEAGRDADTFNHSAQLKGSWAGKFGYLDTRLTTSYRFSLIDRNLKYRGIDLDSDGVNDSIVSYSKWVTMFNQPGGPKNAITGSSIMDLTLAHKVDVDLLLGLELSKKVKLLVDLSYMPIDLSIRDSHLHILDSENLKDDSSQRLMLMSDWGNADGMAILVLAPGESGISWRFGAGYERVGYSLGLDGTQKTGVSIYSRENPGNFTEAALGLEPVNGTVVAASGEPSQTIAQMIRALIAFEWRPAKGVSLLGSISVEAGRLEKVYRVFNTSTRSVWQETETSDSLTWGLTPRFCLSFPAGKSATLSAMVEPTASDSGFSRSLETMPYDMALKRQSKDGSVDLNERSGLAFDYSIRLTVRK